MRERRERGDMCTPVSALSHSLTPTHAHLQCTVQSPLCRYLSGYAPHYRQTVLLSSFLNPEMSHLLSSCCSNFEGSIRATPEQGGVLSAVVPQVRASHGAHGWKPHGSCMESPGSAEGIKLLHLKSLF